MIETIVKETDNNVIDSVSSIPAIVAEKKEEPKKDPPPAENTVNPVSTVAMPLKKMLRMGGKMMPIGQTITISQKKAAWLGQKGYV